MKATEEQLTLFPGAFPNLAKTFQPLANKKDSQMKKATSRVADYGLKCSELYRKYGLNGLSQKMSGEPLTSHWTPVGWVWKMKVTKSGLTSFLLLAQERPTKENGCSLWPTPNTVDSKLGTRNGKGQIQLCHIVRNWATPRANDAEKRGNISIDERNRFPSAVKMYATPQARDYRTGQQSRWDNLDKSRNLNDQIGGQLNANWVEILMGFPVGWTDVDCDEPQEWPGWPAPLGVGMMTRTPQARDYAGPEGQSYLGKTVDLCMQIKLSQTGQYPYEPPRIITGQKNRAKRLKCLGNAVVPQQVYPIFAAIMAIEREVKCE